jgi:SAM-dependent methyltransferase
VEAGCGSGAQAQWLLDQGADVVAVDVSPRMIEEAERRCAGRGRFLVADLAKPLAATLGSFADAGFMVDRVAEPQPSAGALRQFPDDLGPVVGVPLFIVYRLWLQP